MSVLDEVVSVLEGGELVSVLDELDEFVTVLDEVVSVLEDGELVSVLDELDEFVAMLDALEEFVTVLDSNVDAVPFNPAEGEASAPAAP